MKKLAGLLIVGALFLMAGYAQAAQFWYSPLTAFAVGPAGPPSALVVGPHSSPSTALKVTTTATVLDTDYQWVLIPLTVPNGSKIRGLKVCYDVNTEHEGSTYISQVRLTKMTTPNVATVIYDNPTNLTSTTRVCQSFKLGAGPTISGTTTLALKMVFESTDDVITIGGLELLLTP